MTDRPSAVGSACRAKVDYPTREDAERAVLALHGPQRRTRGKRRYMAYACRFCPHWHVGHGRRGA